ncbi:MAG: hypothetical protein OXI88_20320 [Gammaproteobacteria bacterium]|nr:hypothetical protein [Gammaproteobacteria bacterium]MDE0283491.1 hypothetical protein [Gammaproteobacteria bacterium]MDE0514118.1 hypothetical protein [Gammaproteobacteria bacterium]
MTRKRQWQIVGLIYLVGALLWLSSCDRLDVDVVEVEAEVPGKVSGIDKPLVLHVRGRENISDADLYAWAAKECRDNLVLPPVAAVPVIQRHKTDPQTGRQQIRITCYRDKWSVPE